MSSICRYAEMVVARSEYTVVHSVRAIAMVGHLSPLIIACARQRKQEDKSIMN